MFEATVLQIFCSKTESGTDLHNYSQHTVTKHFRFRDQIKVKRKKTGKITPKIVMLVQKCCETIKMKLSQKKNEVKWPNY